MKYLDILTYLTGAFLERSCIIDRVNGNYAINDLKRNFKLNILNETHKLIDTSCSFEVNCEHEKHNAFYRFKNLISFYII